MVFPPQRPGNFFPANMQNMPRMTNPFFMPSRGMPNIQQTGSGSWLQRLLNPGSGGSAIPNAFPGGTGSSGGLSGMLGNVQQVLKVVETTAPIVKQYGPMIKNLPAMYRMLKAFKDIGNESSDDNNTDTDNKEAEDRTDAESSNIDDSGMEETKEEAIPTRKTNGKSVPKLYI